MITMGHVNIATVLLIVVCEVVTIFVLLHAYAVWSLRKFEPTRSAEDATSDGSGRST